MPRRTAVPCLRSAGTLLRSARSHPGCGSRKRLIGVRWSRFYNAWSDPDAGARCAHHRCRSVTVPRSEIPDSRSRSPLAHRSVDRGDAGGLPGNERISRDGFAALFDELAPACDRDFAECWEILRDLEGATGPHVVVSNIAEALEDPLLEIVRDYEGNTGPLLSTIHAIKGRESDRVFLLLTKAPAGEDVDWDEEARTLYVGATRASAELRTGWITPNKYFRTGRPERYWAPRAGYRMLEIGLDGDLLSWADLVKEGLVPKPRETIAAIWAAARNQSSIRGVRNKAGQYILSLTGENSPAGLPVRNLCRDAARNYAS